MPPQHESLLPPYSIFILEAPPHPTLKLSLLFYCFHFGLTGSENGAFRMSCKCGPAPCGVVCFCQIPGHRATPPGPAELRPDKRRRRLFRHLHSQLRHPAPSRLQATCERPLLVLVSFTKLMLVNSSSTLPPNLLCLTQSAPRARGAVRNIPGDVRSRQRNRASAGHPEVSPLDRRPAWPGGAGGRGAQLSEAGHC